MAEKLQLQVIIARIAVVQVKHVSVSVAEQLIEKKVNKLPVFVAYHESKRGGFVS